MSLEKYKTACGNFIVIPPRAQIHLQAHPEVSDILPIAIGKIKLPPSAQRIELAVDLGYVVGRSRIINTETISINDRTSFAFRINRKFPSRIAPNDTVGSPATSVVVIAKPSSLPYEYELITAWIGSLAKKEPWDSNILSRAEFEDCLRYWTTSALVHVPENMGNVFESSWKDIFTLSKSKFAPN